MYATFVFFYPDSGPPPPLNFMLLLFCIFLLKLPLKLFTLYPHIQFQKYQFFLIAFKNKNINNIGEKRFVCVFK